MALSKKDIGIYNRNILHIVQLFRLGSPII